mmetsp:Transcript_4271/g.15966  ORF Transcript_4271/g.15966 Transcript_4271/m.15966 type:complete len:224 (+) Transcript_4271:328-999(+)
MRGMHVDNQRPCVAKLRLMMRRLQSARNLLCAGCANVGGEHQPMCGGSNFKPRLKWALCPAGHFSVSASISSSVNSRRISKPSYPYSTRASCNHSSKVVTSTAPVPCGISPRSIASPLEKCWACPFFMDSLSTRTAISSSEATSSSSSSSGGGCAMRGIGAAGSGVTSKYCPRHSSNATAAADPVKRPVAVASLGCRKICGMLSPAHSLSVSSNSSHCAEPNA